MGIPTLGTSVSTPSRMALRALGDCFVDFSLLDGRASQAPPYLPPSDKASPYPHYSEGRGYAYRLEGEDQRERLVRLALVVVLLHIIDEGTID